MAMPRWLSRFLSDGSSCAAFATLGAANANIAERGLWLTAQPLELAATATGGEHLGTFKNHTIENAIDEIGGELHSQYSLSYIPSGTNQTGYHEIKVEVKKPGLKVRARPGYYIAGPES